ncbi:MAG: PfkB family carbohydrate kinase [Thermoplasmata archaeon]|nr:PfkB family carbohydrate kinase [Thermoplasmata archaeon]
MPKRRGLPGEAPTSPSLVVAGHTNLDHFLRVARLPDRDRTVPVTRRETALGGTAANIARSAAAFGVPVALVSRVGDDFPTEFTEKLVREGVDVRGIEHVPGGSSPACYIVEDLTGGQMTFIDQGVMQDARSAVIPKELIEAAPWVHLTTGDPQYMLKLAKVARGAGQRVAVDPAQEIHYRWDARGLRQLVSHAEILFGNASEIGRARTLLGVRREADLTELVPTVVMTLGARGAKAFTRAGIVSVPGTRVRRLAQVTGAGDSFRGGFYAGWFAGEPLKGCLTAGTRAAARWIESGGELRPASTRGRGR